MSNLINRSYAKRQALAVAATRSHTFTRVSSDFLDAVEVNTRAFIENRVLTHPSAGKTLN